MARYTRNGIEDGVYLLDSIAVILKKGSLSLEVNGTLHRLAKVVAKEIDTLIAKEKDNV